MKNDTIISSTSSKSHKTSISVLEKGLRYILPFVVSIGLILWLFHKVNVHEVAHVLKEGVNYWWLIAMIGVLILSRTIRGIRWGYQLRAAGVPRLTATAEAMSIYGAYALNLVFSWVGEAWRCIFVSRRKHAPLSTVVGTDIGDRASDAVVVIALVIFSFFVARPALDRFMDYYSVGRDMLHFFTDAWMWCILAAFIGLLLIAARIWHHSRAVQNVEKIFTQLWQGFKVLFTMPHQIIYWTLTLCIWICYFLMTYLCFFAFPFLHDIITAPGMVYGLVPGLVVFVFGSCSIAVPSTGGLGPWNLAVMFALSLYGVSNAEGAAYSLVVWGFQTGIQILLGVICAIYVACTSPRDKEGSVREESHTASTEEKEEVRSNESNSKSGAN